MVLSPLGVYNDLAGRFNRNGFYIFGFSSQNNTVAPRIIQLGLKFFF
ncbi:MAG: hypothetical protein ACREEM_05295 [Blastocatellia bacterium]